jgi:hypothetical protein
MLVESLPSARMRQRYVEYASAESLEHAVVVVGAGGSSTEDRVGNYDEKLVSDSRQRRVNDSLISL